MIKGEGGYEIFCHTRALTRVPRYIMLNSVVYVQRFYYVYILASGRNGTLYIGVTGNLPQRIYEHKIHALPGFTDKYNVDKLVYFERFEDVHEAIKHEKRLKKWERNWKKDLIEKFNPEWRDLYDDLNNLL